MYKLNELHMKCFFNASFLPVSNLLYNCYALAAAIRGADTLKTRLGCKNGGSPVLPIEDNNEPDFDFKKCRSILGKGTELNVETPQGMGLYYISSLISTNYNIRNS